MSIHVHNRRAFLKAGSMVLAFCFAVAARGEETLPPLKGGKAPESFEALWSGFDPRKEPLDVEVLHQWEQDDVVLKVIRYRVGVFKGKKAMMAAVYGYPKGGTKVPGLVQIHGGGQGAAQHACITNGKRGYATLSLAWAGRLFADKHHIQQKHVQMLWEGKTDDPDYKRTTDWATLNAYHAPGRGGKDLFNNLKPDPMALDNVESPRNNAWFWVALGARRGLTFLEQQPEVDNDRLGVYGHSMGGKLTVMTAAADSRVKAAAPSCGGISDNDRMEPLYEASISDAASLKRIKCPIVFLSPANDFHGRISDLPGAVKLIQSTEWRVTCSAHWNHGDWPEYEVATQLWFDQHLKKSFVWPDTPEVEMRLKTEDGIPRFSVVPDPSRELVSVDIYFTRHGDLESKSIYNTVARFWHHLKPEKSGRRWTAPLPILGTDRPLWVYANILYKLDKPITGAGYYYAPYTAEHYNLSSVVKAVSAAELQEAGVTASEKPTLEIESFKKDWEKEWFYWPGKHDWHWSNHKLYDDKYQPPKYAKLVFELRSHQPNRLVMLLDQQSGLEIDLKGSGQWQRFTFHPSHFKDAKGTCLTRWQGVKQIRLCQSWSLGGKVDLGGTWKGPRPEFRSLRWSQITKDEMHEHLRTTSGATRIAEGGLDKPGGLRPNIALGSIVKASSFFPNTEAENAIDGNVDSIWASQNDGAEGWLHMDLRKSYRITHVAYKSRLEPSNEVTSFLLTFDDGTSQLCLMDRNAMGEWQYFDVKDVVSNTVRWDAFESGKHATGARELSVYGTQP